MMKTTALASFAATLLAPVAAFAHPGHGVTDASSWLHQLAEPEHALWLLVPVAALVGLQLWRKRLRT